MIVQIATWSNSHSHSQSLIDPHCWNPIAHRLTAYKIVGHFFGLSYRKISGSNQVKNSFFRISNISVPCPHAQLRGRAVNRKLWTFFRTLGSGSLSVTAILDFWGKANTSIHGLGEDDTANGTPALVNKLSCFLEITNGFTPYYSVYDVYYRNCTHLFCIVVSFYVMSTVK